MNMLSFSRFPTHKRSSPVEPIGDQKSGSDIFTEVDLLTPSSPGAVQVYPPPAEPALPAWDDDEDGEDEEDSDFSTDSGQAGDDDMTSPEGVDRRVIVTEHSHSHQ